MHFHNTIQKLTLSLLALSPIYAQSTSALKCLKLYQRADMASLSLPELPQPKEVRLDKVPAPVPGVRDSAVAAIMSEGQVLMNQRGGPIGHGKWGLIGGKLDHGETIRKGLLRELSEEVGVEEIDNAKVIYVHYFRDKRSNQTFRVFVIRADLPAYITPRILEKGKLLRLEWFWPDQLPKNLFSEFDAFRDRL